MAPGNQVDIADLPPELQGAGAAGVSTGWITALEQEADVYFRRGDSGILETMTGQFERALILRALAYTGGRRIEASQLLGMGRNTLTRKIQELGLEEGLAQGKK
jgi:two-component system, NtrC family, nitrogen regulation response regulator GlnG